VYGEIKNNDKVVSHTSSPISSAIQGISGSKENIAMISNQK
jgi:hypothetical protein